VPDKLEVVPGPGLVARFGDLTVWAGQQSTAALQVHLAAEAQRFSQSATGGDELASSIIAVLQRGDPEPQSPFAVVGPGANGLTLFLHGPVQAWDSGRWLAPQPVPGWMVTSIGRPWPLIVLPYGAPPPPQSQQGNPYDLVAGAVPGSGFVLLRPPGGAAQSLQGAEGAQPQGTFGPAPTGTPVATPATPAQAAGPNPSPVPGPAAGPTAFPGAGPTAVPGPGPAAMAQPANLVDLRAATAPLAAPLPLAAAWSNASAGGGDRPQVSGANCPLGHFNHARAGTCMRCGQPLSAGAAASGPRPPVGILLADDGSVWSLDRNCVIGTEPTAAPQVQSGAAFGIALQPGPGHTMAPVHAEVQLRDWSASIVDRGAEGGTCTQAPDGQTWSQLGRDQQRDLPNGAHLSCGGRVLTFLSCWPAP
jgi:hypothetical protein